MLLQIPAYEETVLGDVLPRYEQNSRYFILVSCFEGTVWHVLRVECPAVVKSPHMWNTWIYRVQVLGVKCHVTGEYCKWKRNKNEHLLRNFV